MNPRQNDNEALRDMTAFAEQVKLPTRLLFSEDLFVLCRKDGRPPIQGMPPVLFNVLLAVACEFTSRLCCQSQSEDGEVPLLPCGARVRADVIIQASLRSCPPGQTVTVRLADSAADKPYADAGP